MTTNAATLLVPKPGIPATLSSKQEKERCRDLRKKIIGKPATFMIQGVGDIYGTTTGVAKVKVGRKNITCFLVEVDKTVGDVPCKRGEVVAIRPTDFRGLTGR